MGDIFSWLERDLEKLLEERHREIALEKGDTSIISASYGFSCVQGTLLCLLGIMRFYF